VRRASKGTVRLLTTEQAETEKAAEANARAKKDAAEAARFKREFAASAKRDLASYRQAGVKFVRTMATGDSCDSCKELAERRIPIGEADGVLPHSGCTGARGWCRCVWVSD
jgi:hypothetical protein